jgi:hypothetical protein
MRGVVLAVMLVASTAHADPEQRARETLAAQLAFVNDPAGLASALGSDAVIFGNGSTALARGPHATAVLATLAASRSGLPVRQSTIDHLVAGGDDHVLWLDAQVTLALRAPVGKLGPSAMTARIAELVVDQRVVAFGFQPSAGATAPGDALARPTSGPLVALALEPWRDRDVRVIGALEMRDAAWGFVAAELTADGHDARALVLAVPAERGTWQVVAQLRQE